MHLFIYIKQYLLKLKLLISTILLTYLYNIVKIYLGRDKRGNLKSISITSSLSVILILFVVLFITYFQLMIIDLR